MSSYRKKPVVVEAVQLLWSTWSEMCEHAGVGKLIDGKPEGTYLDKDGKPVERGDLDRLGLLIPTLEGVMVGVEGDWIIRGTQGELYPCKPAAFADTFEPVCDAPTVQATRENAGTATPTIGRSRGSKHT